MKEFVPIVNDGELILTGEGDIAVCTLWTPRERWQELLKKAGAEKEIPRVCVVGNLYDPRGMENMARNLYANPHVKAIYLVGADLSKNLVKAFDEAYRSISVPVKDKDPVECSLGWLVRYDYADRKEGEPAGEWFRPMRQEPPEKTFLMPPDVECVSLETPVPGALFYGDTLKHVWDRLRYYIQQFGTQYKSRYGNTLEIIGMTTVVPASPYEEGLPFTEKEGEDYVQFLLDFNEKPEVSYDYGPLIGGIMDIEKEQFSTRHAFWPVYAPHHRGTKEPPCLVSCWFKERQGVLHGCYVFRSQDMYAGYTRNVYGLHRFQKLLAEKHGLECGPVVTQTHSAHLYERDIDLYLKNPRIVDPAGDCIITVEKNHIQVDIVRGEQLLLRLMGKSHRVLEEDLRPYISDVSHAMYLGRELYKAEQRLKANK